MSPQSVINESSTKQHWNINVSGITRTKKISSKVCASKSSRSHQRLFKESSKVTNQSSCNETSKFEDQHIKNFNDQQRLHPKIRNFLKGSSKSHQRIINEEAMKHRWYRGRHNKNKKDQKGFHRNYQCFNYVPPKCHQLIIDQAAMKHQCIGD